MLVTLWEVKEPTHYSKRVGHGVPSIVVCPTYVVYRSCTRAFQRVTINYDYNLDILRRM